jgi:hypothetical protein
MNKIVVLLAFMFILGASGRKTFAQEYEMSVSPGIITPLDFWYYKEGKVGPHVGLSFAYLSAKKIILSSNISKGRFGYNPSLSELAVNGQAIGPESSQVDVYFFYLGIGKAFAINENLEWSVNSGFGFFLENRLAFNTSDPNGNEKKDFSRDATFPIQTEIKKEVYPKLWLGLKTGVFLTPFYTLGGFHIGPTLSWRL